MAMQDQPSTVRKPPGVSAADHVRRALEDAIAEGDLMPGKRLEEEELAARFGVSRTPVREALRMLSISGLVAIEPRKGAVVAALGMDRLIELFEAMSELEGVCGRLAARRITEREMATLVDQHERCATAAREAVRSADGESFDRYYAENAVFHEMIYRASHNAYLSDEVQSLRRRLQPYRRLQLRMAGRVQESLGEHQRIVDAITARNEAAAETLLRAHVSIQGHLFADWMASVRTLLARPAE